MASSPINDWIVPEIGLNEVQCELRCQFSAVATVKLVIPTVNVSRVSTECESSFIMAHRSC
jgi:hypothetical protein